MAGSLGSTAVPKISIGSAPVVRVSLGTALLWDGVPFVPVSAKLTTAFPTSKTSYTQVKGFTADSAYPGSTVVADALIIPNAGEGVTLSASMYFNAGSSYPLDLTLQLWLDGVNIKTGTKATAPAFGSSTATVSITGQAVSAGSQLVLYALGGSQFNAPTIPVNASSYLRASMP
ncbi:hypothetical protein ACIGO9_28895 [Nocardia asteroides]|uniref:hypothetical protein n=1 Tax=Nocardia asteroides TaxID=1824 RepID=UPI0037C6B611